VGVEVLELELVDQLVQADGVSAVEPQALLPSHLLGVDDLDDSPEATQVQLQVFAHEVLAVVADGVPQDDDGAVEPVQLGIAADFLDQDIRQGLVCGPEGDESLLSKAIARGSSTVGVGREEMRFLETMSVVVLHT
jgi:hypothetical protein